MKKWKTDDVCPVCGKKGMEFLEQKVVPECDLFGDNLNVHYGTLICPACHCELRASCFDYQVPRIRKHFDPKQESFSFLE